MSVKNFHSFYYRNLFPCHLYIIIFYCGFDFNYFSAWCISNVHLFVSVMHNSIFLQSKHQYSECLVTQKLFNGKRLIWRGTELKPKAAFKYYYTMDRFISSRWTIPLSWSHAMCSTSSEHRLTTGKAGNQYKFISTCKSWNST